MSCLLLSCDAYIYRHSGRYYVLGDDQLRFFLRYLRVFDRLRVACRTMDVTSLPEGMVEVADGRIDVVAVPFFQGPWQYARQYRRIGRALRGVADGCDAAIFRLPSTTAQRVADCYRPTGRPYACEIVYDAGDAWRGTSALIPRLLWKRIDTTMRRTSAGAEGVSCVTERYLQQHYFSTRPGAFTAHYSTLELPASFFGAPRRFPQRRTLTLVDVANQITFHSRKGFKQIIEAMALLHKEGIEVNAKFVGESRDDGVARLLDYAFQLGVGEQLDCTGYLSRAQLSALLDAADLFVLPTFAEGLPRVLIEAMAKGMPAISTPVSGNPELLPAHYLVAYEDVPTLALRIKELVTQPEAYEQASRENFARSQQYEASILETRRDAFYRNLLERTNKR